MMVYFILSAILALLLVFSLMKVSAECSIMWDKTYGGTEWDRGPSLVVASDGGCVLAGYTNSFGEGGADAWLIKTDASGNMMWNHTYGGANFDSASCLVATSDGGYAMAGQTYSLGAGNADFYLVKTDATGNMVWQKAYGGTEEDRAYSLVVTSDGGYALAGYTYFSDTQSYDFWLVKTDSSGNMEWSQAYGGTEYDYAFSLVATSDGGYAIAGETGSFGLEGDFWLVKTDASGNMMWSQNYGGAKYDRAYSLAVSSDGGYVIAGSISLSDENVDFGLVKADASGNEIWQKTYDGDVEDVAKSVIQTSDGGYAVGGFTGDPFTGAYPDAWLVKTDASGNMEWNQIFGGEGYDGVCCVVQTGDGGYALAAEKSEIGTENYDFWLVKTDAEDTTEPSPTDGSALALPIEYVYVAVIAVLIVIVVIALIAYRKRK